MNKFIISALFYIIPLCVFIFPDLALSREICGTEQIIKHRKQPIQKKPLAYTHTDSRCNADFFYDTVYSKLTDHFQIFYTLSGPHKTTKAFVDSVAAIAEDTRKFHTQKLEMLAPLGISKTYHYRQNVEANHYPIEILDISLLRDTESLMGTSCTSCYGLTLPSDDVAGQSQLMLENDFRHPANYNPVLETIKRGELECPYPSATQDLKNAAHDYSYAERWENGIRITLVHELYHTIQLRYADFYNLNTFWFEASASGIEEIAAPDIDDYFNYLPAMSESVGIPLNRMNQSYGAGIFLIYLHNFVDKKIDKFIWENFKKKPSQSFQDHLKAYAEKKGISVDSLFQDFSTKLSFAGSRSNFIDSTALICDDEKNWPNFHHVPTAMNGETAQVQPTVNAFAYRFYSNGLPNLEDFKGKASAILYKDKNAEIRNLKSSNDAELIFANAQANSSIDSIAWVFSNFDGDEILPTIFKVATLHAYPTPWREGSLCFSPLPSDKDFIEIRNRRGNLVLRKNYESSTFCLEESFVKENMAPGVYRFRAGNHGKTTDFIIIY